MDGLRIPPNISVSPHKFVSTPNNGILYVAGPSAGIAYVSAAKTDDPAPIVKIFLLKHNILDFDCDPNWADTKQFAFLDKELVMYVWDLDIGKKVLGHRGHVDAKSVSAAMCYTNNRQIISIVGAICIRYCVTSNTYMTYNLSKNHSVTIVKVSPYDENIVAAGTKYGLIILFNAKDFSLSFTLRGHDSEIQSIDWMLFTSTEKIVRKKSRPKPVADTSDIFDIYDYDYLDDEFGTIADNKVKILEEIAADDECGGADEKTQITNNEKFDFVEACQTLKNDILLGTTSPKREQTADNMAEVKAEDIIGESPNSDNGSCAAADDSDEQDLSHEFETIDQTFDDEDTDDEDTTLKPIEKHCLTSCSVKDNYVWLWDAKEGVGIQKIEMKKARNQHHHYHHRGKDKSSMSVCWLNNSSLAILAPEGDLNVCTVSWTGEKKFVISKKKLAFEETLTFGIITNRTHFNEPDMLAPGIWTVTSSRKLLLVETSTNVLNIRAIYSMMPITQYDIQGCPHDPNKIAIAGNGNRLNIFNETKFSVTDIQMHTFCKNVFGKILALAWHPTKENCLAFSTHEGLVATLDTLKPTNAPNGLMPFSGKPVYRITWGHIEDENNAKSSVLFACSKGELVYYDETKKNELVKVSIEDNGHVSAICANDRLLAIGRDDGIACLYTFQLKKIWSLKIAEKYVSHFAWNRIATNRLAISSMETDIHLVTCASAANLLEMAENDRIHIDGKLSGHQSGVTSIEWSSHTEHRLVSCSFDSSVRVWDTEKLECIAKVSYGSRTHCARFLPSDGNFILASGQSETMHVFDWRNHAVSSPPINDETNVVERATASEIEFKWATELQGNDRKELAKEKKRQKKREKQQSQGTAAVVDTNDVDTELCEAMENVTLTAAAQQPKYTTILHLSNREFNKNTIDCLQSLQNPNENKSLHFHLFESRDMVKKLLDIELKYHHNSNSESIGRLLIPQLCGDLKAEILNNVASKTLTEQHIAVAPKISYEFWRNCCKAYAFQCIEKGWILLAIPYLLDLDQVTEAIDLLCDGHYYREAWVTAKLYKDEQDVQCFNGISKKWIDHLDAKGNLDGAALIAASVKDYETAVRLLSKRRNQDEQILAIIEWMKGQK